MSEIYIKKPERVKAVHWTGQNEQAIIDFLRDWGPGSSKSFTFATLNLGRCVKLAQAGQPTLVATPGDFIIKNLYGEHVSIRSEADFKENYQKEEK